MQFIGHFDSPPGYRRSDGRSMSGIGALSEDEALYNLTINKKNEIPFDSAKGDIVSLENKCSLPGISTPLNVRDRGAERSRSATYTSSLFAL